MQPKYKAILFITGALVFSGTMAYLYFKKQKNALQGITAQDRQKISTIQLQ